MRLVPLLASSLLLTAIAPAATVTMRFETTVDASAFGGSATLPLIATYSFDSGLVPQSGIISEFYGPLLALEVQVGNETVQTFSNTTGSGITIWNDGPDGDAYDVVANFYSPQSVFGFGVNGFHLLLVDPSGGMFSDSSLPATLNLNATICYQQMGVDFVPFATDDELGVSEHDDTPVGDRTPFTLTAVPEPSPLAIFGVAACGATWFRRRERR